MPEHAGRDESLQVTSRLDSDYREVQSKFLVTAIRPSNGGCVDLPSGTLARDARPHGQTRQWSKPWMLPGPSPRRLGIRLLGFAARRRVYGAREFPCLRAMEICCCWRVVLEERYEVSAGAAKALREKAPVVSD